MVLAIKDDSQSHFSQPHARHRNLFEHGTTICMQDPYCTLELGGDRRRTKIKQEAGKRPVWN